MGLRHCHVQHKAMNQKIQNTLRTHNMRDFSNIINTPHTGGVHEYTGHVQVLCKEAYRPTKTGTSGAVELVGGLNVWRHGDSTIVGERWQPKGDCKVRDVCVDGNEWNMMLHACMDLLGVGRRAPMVNALVHCMQQRLRSGLHVHKIKCSRNWKQTSSGALAPFICSTGFLPRGCIHYKYS
jgi:hypothetical protein